MELIDRLDGMTQEGRLCAAVEDTPGVVECRACAHRCRLGEGDRGVCRMRFVRDGALRVPWGYVASAACDPIEKKPFYHVLPGTEAFSFGMLGCNFHCPFCQNWSISQALRDSEAGGRVYGCGPEELAVKAGQCGARSVASTYNEPLITTEWAMAVFREARGRGLATCYVSNGFASPESIEALGGMLDAVNIDLKCFSDDGYRQLGGRLAPVCDAIRAFHALGVWVEVITLVVPGFNDGIDELTRAAEFLAGVSVDLPWHVTAYHQAYRYRAAAARTSREAIAQAAAIGRRAGLRHVYAGNLGGQDRDGSTWCPGCGELLIERDGFAVLRNGLRSGGCCPACGRVIAGRW